MFRKLAEELELWDTRLCKEFEDKLTRFDTR